MKPASVNSSNAATPDSGWAHVPAAGPILRPSAAAEYFGVSISTYYELIQAGVVPPFIKLSHRARASGVPKVWLDAAIAARANA